MTWLVVGALGSSFLVSAAACGLVRVLAPRLGLVDRPGHRKIHQQPIPTGGGIGIFLGVAVPLACGFLALTFLSNDSAIPDLVQIHRAGLWSVGWDVLMVLGCGLLLLLTGLADDFQGLGWKLRLAIEFALASLIVFAQGWQLTFFVESPWVTRPITVLWIVWLINAFNMLDNMDGLSAGVASIASLLLAAVLLTAPETGSGDPQLFVGGFLLLLGGSLLGFLGHNRAPARLFMGDAGAYFVGFCLAVATILATFSGGEQPRHAVLAPLCVLAVPLYDTLSVVSIRLRQKRNPFEGDKCHFSHRLVDLGLSKPRAVMLICLVSFGCGLGALLLYQVDGFGACVILAMVGILLSVIAILESVALRKKPRHDEPGNHDARG